MTDNQATAKPLSIEEALKTALEFETKVRDVYREAVEVASGATGERVFGVLAREEQDHIDYLNSRLEEWHKTGKITPEKIASVIPSKKVIAEQVKDLQTHLTPDNLKLELGMLQKALTMEEQTSAFYAKMVAEMHDDEQSMFAQFLEIEDGHVAVVQAELDMLQGTGFFFDFGEFNLEAG
ncbi:MAG: ferritin family protein [Candidatus Electryonea clarkiae]|nr:ferritin family protein [Candidatus Electryonea clarkiae]MDP8287483.1 ferritin family protein [Candidatus Electryonea clarkiae]